jgi:hypothetical protein
MNRQRIVSLMLGLATLLAVGIVITQAGLNDPNQVIIKPRIFTEIDVRGAYAFSFEGTVIQLGPIAAAGVVVADGTGSIIDAVRTVNVNGTSVQQTFTCTYSVNPNGTGSADCPLANPLPGAPIAETFDFVLEDAGRAFRLIGTTPGITVIGSGTRH